MSIHLIITIGSQKHDETTKIINCTTDNINKVRKIIEIQNTIWSHYIYEEFVKKKRLLGDFPILFQLVEPEENPKVKQLVKECKLSPYTSLWLNR